MKIKSKTRIICDICGKEIPWTMRSHIKVIEYIHYVGGKFKKRKCDICRDCADEMKDYIRSIKRNDRTRDN